MKSISKDEILARLHWRYATKQFDPTQKISQEEWDILERSLILSPSSFGMEPWKFFVVTDPALRTKMIAASWNQPQVADASHLVVLTAKRGINLSDVEDLIERTATARNMDPILLDSFKSLLTAFITSHTSLDEWAVRQVYIALGQFMTTAALLGIDTCPMEGFHPEKIDELLGLTNSSYRAVLLCPAGYRLAGDKYAELAKVRRTKEDTITYIEEEL